MGTAQSLELAQGSQSVGHLGTHNGLPSSVLDGSAGGITAHTVPAGHLTSEIQGAAQTLPWAVGKHAPLAGHSASLWQAQPL
jgi:hypothetical protein